MSRRTWDRRGADRAVIAAKTEPRKPELYEDDAPIVACGRQDRVCRIAGTPEQVVAAHQAIVFRNVR
jgi:hypothetical protein